MPTISHSTYVRRAPKEVFQALVNADTWNSWFTDETSIEWNESGNGYIHFVWKDFGTDQVNLEDGGEIIEITPNEAFIFQWNPGESITTVSFQLKPYCKGTLVVLSETGYSNTKSDIDACLSCATGWGEALTLFKIYLEKGITFKGDIM